MAYPTIDDLKLWLRSLPSPSFEPDVYDDLLTGLLAAAIEHVETATDATWADDTPERIATAIKFLAGTWFENPIPDEKQTEATTCAVNQLISAYKTFTFPG